MTKFLKIVFYVFGYVAILGVSLLAYAGMGENPSLLREAVQVTFVEAMAVAVMVLLYKYVYVKLFPTARAYRCTFPSGKAVAGIFMVVPIIAFIEVTILIAVNAQEYLLRVDTDFTRADLIECAAMLPVTVIFGPIFEELCCRVFALSSAESRGGKVFASVMTILCFSFLHISSWKKVLPMAVLLTVVYMITKNMMLCILIHMANNLATMLIPGLTGIYVLCVPDAKYGIAGLPIPLVILLAAAFVYGSFLLIPLLRQARKEYSDRRRTDLA